ncbi:hypothetical protein ACETK8_15855 [Brevundimonas staleyi]|uniref:Uncharacterized protein n=1 Tax=Brevundimonas staleyi TaxID=74326 RepID=A0ABW0FYH2_9CAUL
MSMVALTSLSAPPVTPRVGSPSRSAILTALAAAAVRHGNVKAVLVLAQTARPRSLMTCAGEVRWLAFAGLETVYPDAAREALMACFGLKPSRDRRQRAWQGRRAWQADDLAAVARAVSENEAAQLTARWIWPHACALAAGRTGADPAVVATVTGSRATPPRIVARARKLAVYLTVTEGDVNLSAMAAATGLDKSTVRFHVEGLADARDDDAALDEELETLSAELRARLDQELSQW